jgi:hypothetical protein
MSQTAMIVVQAAVFTIDISALSLGYAGTIQAPPPPLGKGGRYKVEGVIVETQHVGVSELEETV